MPCIVDTTTDTKEFVRISWASPAFTKYRGSSNEHHARKGVPVPAECAPDKIIVHTRRKKLPDFFGVHGMDIAVSQAFKDICESLEPGVHQFLPLSPVYKSGEPIEGAYYLFNCGNLLDTAIVDGQPLVVVHSTVVIDGKLERNIYETRKQVESGAWSYHIRGYPLLLDREVVGGRQIWHDRRTFPKIYFGDEITEALEGAGIHGPFLWARRDVIWG